MIISQPITMCCLLAGTRTISQRYILIAQYLLIYLSSSCLLIYRPSTNLFARRFANEFPVKFRERTFLIGSHLFDSEATGIVFLSKLGQSRLAVVMEGTDDRGFIKARQLFPNKSALMLPDYYVAGPEWGWAGDGGLLAAGFWNNNWEFDESIGFISS